MNISKWYILLFASKQQCPRENFSRMAGNRTSAHWHRRPPRQPRKPGGYLYFTLYVCFWFVCVFVCLSSLYTSSISPFTITKFNHTYLYVNNTKLYIFLFLFTSSLFRSHLPFSSLTIFFISRLQANLSSKSIHQIEAWD